MSQSIQQVAVIGDGAMGTLCSLLLADNGCTVRLWGRNPEHVAALREERENRRYLPGRTLPETIEPVSEAKAAFAGADCIVSAVPCQFMRPIWQRIAAQAPSDVPVVSVAKGIENDTLLTPTAIIADCLPVPKLASLSGPNIAPEIAAQKPASAVVASGDAAFARRVQEALSNNYFRVYTCRDLIGVELAGASKNVIALAAGMCDGIGAGDNAKAALLTRGLVEITRLGVALGAEADTFRGLAGVGDLFTTCVSKVGRNRTAGERIGRGEKPEQVVSSTDSVIEGIATTQSVLALADKHDVEMPIVAAVASVLFEGRKPTDAIEDLMARPLRDEQPV